MQDKYLMFFLIVLVILQAVYLFQLKMQLKDAKNTLSGNYRKSHLKPLCYNHHNKERLKNKDLPKNNVQSAENNSAPKYLNIKDFSSAKIQTSTEAHNII